VAAARALTNTFAGIAPGNVLAFIGAECLGAGQRRFSLVGYILKSSSIWTTPKIGAEISPIGKWSLP
jgi:hypothetical protein